MAITCDEPIQPSNAAWGAVVSMTLCVATLIASEFMPVSLLSPLATDLGITEGQAGQAPTPITARSLSKQEPHHARNRSPRSWRRPL